MSNFATKFLFAVTVAPGALAGCGERPLSLAVYVSASPGIASPEDATRSDGTPAAETPTSSASEDPAAAADEASALPRDPTTPGADPVEALPTGLDAAPVGGDDDGSSAAACNTFTVSPVLSTSPLNGFVPTREWRFSATETTLYVHAVLTGVADSAHKLGFYFYVPNGSLYRHEFVKFTVGSPIGGIQGYAWEYVQASTLAEGAVVSYSFSLTDGPFDINIFAGAWRLAVVLDDDPNPITSVWFEITPRQ